MITDKEYNWYIKFAEGKFRNGVRSGLDAVDAVNSAYVMCADKNDFSRKQFVQNILTFIYVEKNKEARINSLVNTRVNPDCERKCNKCNKYKSEDFFYKVYLKKYNIDKIDSYCKECRKSINNEAPTKRKYTDRGKEYQKINQRKIRFELPDWYIAFLLRKKGLRITQQSIIDRRNEILQKRTARPQVSWG